VLHDYVIKKKKRKKKSMFQPEVKVTFVFLVLLTITLLIDCFKSTEAKVTLSYEAGIVPITVKETN
jgi:hypothetical protein